MGMIDDNDNRNVATLLLRDIHRKGAILLMTS